MTDEPVADDDPTAGAPSDGIGDADPVAQDELPDPDDLLDTSGYRLSDKQALGLLGGWFVFRLVIQRIGLAYLPRLMGPAPWVLPLMNNSMVVMILVGTDVEGTGELAAVGAASLLLSTISGLILYWAGWRFGPELAKKAETGHPVWASIWNPKQARKAHRWIEKYGFIAVALGRSFEWLTTPVMLVAGSTRMTLWKFLASHTVGAIGFAAGTIWIGARASDIWPWLPDRIQSWANWSARIAIGLLVLLVIAFLLGPRQQENAEGTSEEPSDTRG